MRLPVAAIAADLCAEQETRPTWGKHRGPNPCALLQIAMRDADRKEEVFLLDLRCLPATVYNRALTGVFLSKKTIKLGQSFFQDLQELAKSYPHASCFTVCKSVVEVNDLSIVLAGAHNPLSLQKLVFFYLHRKLAKTQQVSNWERRPLTASQVHYAAADALVLIHLYDEILLQIKKQHGEQKFQLSDVANVLDVNLPRSPKCSLCFEVFEMPAELKKHRKLCTVDVRTLVICTVCEGTKLVTEKAMDHHVRHCGVDEELAEPIIQVQRKRSLSMENRSSSAKSRMSSSGKKRRLEVSDAEDSKTTPAAEKDASGADTADGHLNKHRKAVAKAKRMTKRKAKKQAAKNRAKIAAAAGGNTCTASSAHQGEKTHNKDQQTNTPAKKKKKRKAKVQVGEAPSCWDQAHKNRKMSMESSLLASDAMWSQISSDCSTTSAA
ncbi:unnamed protein product [Phytophthora fragariaefolia]|uniref:Unnamed protein product n=1 Tax=Phytophthora fragariaefolia TaxID=1490495 RepID=A0A9W7CM23_9STRA|nr:unnamed protein product [Phytophthora fragariaefolia]